MLEPVLDGPQNLSYVNFAPLFTPPAGRIGASLVLAPAMAVMDQMPELMQNSGYSALPDRLAARWIMRAVKRPLGKALNPSLSAGGATS